MKKIINALVFVLVTLVATSSYSYNSDPKIFIYELVDDALKTLNNKDIKISDKNKKIETMALQNVDIDALGMYTLGPIRKTVDPTTLKKYKVLFEKYLLKSLTSRLTDYSSNKFQVLEANQKNSKYTIVKSKIIESSNQPEIKIDWRIYTKDKKNPVIRDLIIEGLSLARTQKEEFASILNSKDGDIKSLFKTLEEFSNK